MAVIICPYCKKYISSQVDVCPECGNTLSPSQSQAETTPSADVTSQSSADVDPTPSATPVAASDASVTESAGQPHEYEVQFTTDTPDDSPTDTPVETSVDAPAGMPDELPEVTEVIPAAFAEAPAQSEPAADEAPTAADAVAAVAPVAVRKAWYQLTVRKGVALFFFVLTISGIVYFLIADHRRDVGYEQRAFERLDGCTNLLWYEDYLIRFPDGAHAEEVKQMYAKAQKEHDEFFKKAAGGSRESLQAFIKEHPTSPYVKVCQNRIDSLDWEVALTANNAQGYQQYLELHPDGLFAAIATDSKTRLAKLEVSNEERSMLSGSLDTFLSAMASGDEGRVNSLISSTMSFCGETNATGANVVSFQKLNFHHDDIIGVHFTVGGLNVKKKPSDTTPGAYDFVVNASLDAVLNRTNTDSTGVQAWKITAILSPDRKFRSVDIRRQ